MRMRRHRRDLRPVSEINLTSLLDVSFVLLISFMLVAPSLKYGLELDLPSITAGAPPLAADSEHLAVILVPIAGASGQEYFLDDSPVTLADLEQRLTDRQAASGGKLSVEIRVDRTGVYDAFIQVVAAVRRAGIQAVGLPVEAETVPPPNNTLLPPS